MSALALALVALSAAATPDAGRTPPLYFDRPVTAADLKGKPLRELSLMRNTIFARAGQVFRKPFVRDYFLQFDWYKPTGLDLKKLSPLDTANAATIANYELAIPEGEYGERLVATEAKIRKVPPKENPRPEDVTEMVLLYEAIGFDPTPAMLDLLGLSGPKNPLLEPEALDQLLTTAQLNELSKRDLRILRNTVFARRGRLFTTMTMNNYFSGKRWYHQDPKYTDKRLTKIDLANIKLIRSVEESLGGPEIEGESPDGFMQGA